ncbi:MAG: ribulose-phosphate 3-epimerase [Thermodesulfovibrionaceae bacterium]
MVLIAPSILSADFGRLAEEIIEAEQAGVDMIHIDVMDGHFVPNITVGPLVVEAVRKVTKLPLDVHLMIINPEKYIQDFINAGADIITVHLEACIHLNRVVGQIKEKNIKAGVSLNPATPLSFIDEIIHEIDLLLIMTVNPGFGGQQFISSCLDKIKRAKSMILSRGFNALVEVDGGVKLENSIEIVKAGADILVIGSAFFSATNYKEFMRKLREQLNLIKFL